MGLDSIFDSRVASSRLSVSTALGDRRTCLTTRMKRLSLRMLVLACVLAAAVAHVVVPVPVKDPDVTSFTVLHMTDLHGWVNGHPHQPELDADLGDVRSLVTHMSQQEDSHFLLFDSGDLVHGTGYSDASPVHGQYVVPLVAEIPFDAATLGNHDVGDSEILDVFRASMLDKPADKERYVTENSGWSKEHSPFGLRYKWLQRGRFRILVLGFMFSFRQSAPDAYVDRVAEAVATPEVQETFKLAQDADFVVVLGHIAVHENEEFAPILHSLRTSIGADKPVLLLGGHTHRRVWHQWDAQTWAIESGRYLEVLGMLRFSIDTASGKLVDMQHSFEQTSRSNFHRLARTSAASFPTPEGQRIKTELAELTRRFHLRDTIGCAKHGYDPYANYFHNSTYSSYHLYVNEVFPKVVFDPHRKNTQVVSANASKLRMPIYAGKITLDDMWCMSPFNSTISVIPDVPGDRMIAYRTWMYRDGEGERPRHFLTPGEYDPHAMYDLLCSDYDCFQASGWLARLFPDDPVRKWQTYSRPMGETDLWARFIAKYMHTC